MVGFRGAACAEDFDECAEKTSRCLNGATCENIHGSYRYLNYLVYLV